MKILRNTVLATALGLVSGCCATTDIIRSDYVEADRATYEAVAPRYLQYVQADESLDSDEKKRRERTINTWRLRLEQAETPITPEGE